MIRLLTPENDFDTLHRPQDALAGILYEFGFDLAEDFVQSLQSLCLTGSFYDLLKLYITIGDNGVSIVSAALLSYYDSSFLGYSLSLLEKRSERYSNGFNLIASKVKNVLNSDLSILDWLGYSLNYEAFRFNPTLFIDWVTSVDQSLTNANSYLKQGFLLFFVKEVLKLKSGYDISVSNTVYAQWINIGLNTYPIGASFDQSIGANHYV